MIVGFPGETQEEFEITREFLKKVHFYEMHVFKYSKRAGTRAAVMPDQVPEQVKGRRSDVLLELEASMSREYREHFIGSSVWVLFEDMAEVEGRKYIIGHTPQYVKAALAVKDGEENRLSGQILCLKAAGLLGGDLLEVGWQ